MCRQQARAGASALHQAHSLRPFDLYRMLQLFYDLIEAEFLLPLSRRKAPEAGHELAELVWVFASR